ncbi:putative ankyrin repeat-containing domain-containing protein [Rosa chinensis]|uniref:Putative ankyrin repeat-containing domain-containing protein n=1 Tax=Rosa chinensis TaxID=74649 RepID=A0A2P6PB10_ROSCH|nr:putative ankyrin repeat protein RF_0381 [Rosa chinensis]PRQ19107.1 putative ankyrin repeat-containing domain-containing protein [Rosa chinensis]
MGNRRKGTSGGGETDLHAAARSGDLSAVQVIVSSNPLKVNGRDKHSRTPLHLAAWAGQTEVVNFLCKNKADVGAAAMDDMKAIHFAAQKGHLEVVRALLSSGASVKSSTRKGLTPLHFAVQGSHVELIKYLARKGADLTTKTKAGKTPLDLASNDEVRSCLEECERSSEKGDLNGKQKDEESDPKTTQQEDVKSGGEAPDSVNDEHAKDESLKRKGDNSEEASGEPKRARVSLNHLLTADDDIQDDE